MTRHLFSSLLVLLGLISGPALARDLQVEVEVQHIGGMLTASELDSLLTSERLNIEVIYHPTRLIDGITARSERTMPFGSRLFAINQYLTRQGTQVERQARTLRFQVPEIHPEHPDYYRMRALSLRVPLAPGQGRPQPDMRIGLLHEPRKIGAHETAIFIRNGAFDLGLRLRYRWSDAQGPIMADETLCRADIQPLGNGAFRFRPRHRVAGLFRFFAPTVHSDPPSRPPAGQRSVRMHEPYPDPLTGWRLSRNHMVQLEIDGQTVERLSVYAEQQGAARCRRTRAYEALFAAGQLVEVQRRFTTYDCSPGDKVQSQNVEASWLDDGSLARYVVSSAQGSQTWDGFAATAPDKCGSTAAAPAVRDVQALTNEFSHLRETFLRQ